MWMTELILSRMKNGSYFIIKCTSSVPPEYETSGLWGCSDPDPPLGGCINSTSLPCQQHNTPGTNLCLGVHKRSSHWTHYSAMKQVGHCAVCSAHPTESCPVPHHSWDSQSGISHWAPLWTCMNHLKMFLFWGVCQKFKIFCSNLSSRSVKAKGDAATLQPLWRAPCCGGHGAHKWKRVVMRNSEMGKRNGDWFLKKHGVWAAHALCDTQG